MSNPMKMSMKLSSSFPYGEVAGDWANSYEIVQDDGSKIRHEYLLTYLIDYMHLYYHIGISINEIDEKFHTQIHKILEKTRCAIYDIQNTKLSGEELHFSGKIFIVTNTKNIDYNKLRDEFKSKGLSLTIYTEDDEKLKIISPIVNYTPVEEYKKEVQNGEKKVAFASANYTIFKGNKGEISYSLRMSIEDGNFDQVQIHKNLSKLSPYKQKFDGLLHNIKQKKRYTSILCNAMKDVFEGDLESAIKTLEFEHDKLYRRRILRNGILSIITSAVWILLVYLVNFKTNINNEQLSMSMILSTFGAIVSLYIPNTELNKSGYTLWYEYVLEIIVKLLVGVFSGIVIYLVVKSNLLFGFLDKENLYAYYLVTLISGWSNKFLPQILKNVEKKISKEEI